MHKPFVVLYLLCGAGLLCVGVGWGVCGTAIAHKGIVPSISFGHIDNVMQS
jgi:hypothetical protein